MSASDPVGLTLIIPAFNEEARLERTLDEVERWLPSALVEVEILVVDDGSTDRTAAVAAAHSLASSRLRVIRLPVNRGKGAAVGAGVAEARGAHVLFMDADLATPLEHYRDIAVALETADVAVGARGLRDSRIEVDRPLHRRAMSVVFNGLSRALVGVGVSDVLCGFKGFRREAAQRIFADLRAERFAFDVELFALARAHGLRVVEIPITWRHDARSSVHPLAHSLEAFVELCGIAYRIRGR